MVKHHRLVTLIGLAFATILGSGSAPSANSGDALPYSKGFLVTGNYLASGVDLNETDNPIDVNGFSTGVIHIKGVPADADIVAAYLYFETITMTSALSQAAGVKFRDQTVLL